MTVLVTGSAGFLGRAVVRAFTRDGVDVLATDSGAAADVDFRPGTEPARVSYVQRDLEHEPLNDLVEQVDGVVYAAALTPRDETAGDVADRLLTVNLNGVSRHAGCDPANGRVSAGAIRLVVQRV